MATIEDIWQCRTANCEYIHILKKATGKGKYRQASSSRIYLKNGNVLSAGQASIFSINWNNGTRIKALSEKKLTGVHVLKGDATPFFTLSFQAFDTLRLSVSFCLILISGCIKKEPIPPARKEAPVPALIIGLVLEQNIS